MQIENLKLTRRQLEAYLALNDPSVVDVMYGGAKGGGKSVFACWWGNMWANAIVKKYGLKPSVHPPHIGFMGRKQAVDFSGSTLQTWHEVVPEGSYELKGASDKHPKHILINKTVAIDYGGFDREETINKFNSAEYVFIIVDQAEELTQDDVSVLRAARRMKIAGKELHYKGLFTANPAPCWLRGEFILDPPVENRFVQALPADNPHLPSTYVRMLQESFKHRPHLLQAYLYGNWDLLEGVEQVIKESWIVQAMSRTPDYWPYLKRYIAVDTARFGDDETVILVMLNSDIIEKIVMPYCKTTQISALVSGKSEFYSNCPIVVESTGADIGAGVIDELSDMGRDVTTFNPAGASSDPKKYYSARCEAWHRVGQMFASGLLDPASNMAMCLTDHKEDSVRYGMDQLMRSQLCAPLYKWRSGKLVIEPKDETKKRLGRSPDHADAYIIGLRAWSQMPRIEDSATRYREKYRESRYSGTRTAMDV